MLPYQRVFILLHALWATNSEMVLCYATVFVFPCFGVLSFFFTFDVQF